MNDNMRERVEKKQKRNPSSKWPHLQVEILELILQRLFLTDFLRVGAVCSSWRTIVKNALANKVCPHVPEFPLVAFQRESDLSFFNFSKQRMSYPRTIPHGREFVCRGSVEGWLFMVDDHRLFQHKSLLSFFWNPVTDSTIMMPSNLIMTNRFIIQPILLKMVATSAPNSPDCVVVVLFDDYAGSQLAFCKMSDMSWISITAETKTTMGMKEIAVLHGKLYVLTDRLIDSILVYDLGVHRKIRKAKILAKLPERPDRFPFIGWIDGEKLNPLYSWYRYLTTDSESGELLLVYMFVDGVDDIRRERRSTSPPRVESFQVFKLVMMTRKAKWVKVDNLGDRILLQSFTGCKVMSTPGIDGPEELVRGNCICFAHKFRRSSDRAPAFQVGMFSLTEKRTKNYFSLDNSTGGPSSSQPVWFTPST